MMRHMRPRVPLLLAVKPSATLQLAALGLAALPTAVEAATLALLLQRRLVRTPGAARLPAVMRVHVRIQGTELLLRRHVLRLTRQLATRTEATPQVARTVYLQGTARTLRSLLQ